MADALEFGSYEIGAKLREEALATVYAATSRTGTGCELHILGREAEANISLRDDWRRRAELLTQIKHPNLVQVTAAGVVHGRSFFTTEPRSAETFAQFLHSAEMDDDRAAEIARQVAEALAEAHAGGVVGWDLRPEALQYDRAVGPIVADWVLTGEHSATIGLERSVLSAPEPNYDARSDVYAVGVLLLRMIAGRNPTASELERGVIPAGLSRDLEELLRRSLAGDPDERFSSMRGLASALSRSGSTVIMPVPAPSRSQSENIAAPVGPPVVPTHEAPPWDHESVTLAAGHRGNWRRSAALIIVMGLVLGGLAAGAWLYLRPTDDAEACPISDSSLCDFEQDASVAAATGDMRWFAEKLIKHACGDSSIRCSSGDSCVNVGVLGSEGACVSVEDALVDLREQRLFGVLYPVTNILDGARDGPALLFGDAEGERGTMAVLSENDEDWRISTLVSMRPATYALYVKPGQLLSRREPANVHVAWLGDEATAASPVPINTTSVSPTPGATAAPTAVVNPLEADAYAAIVARVEPDTCAYQRNAMSTSSPTNIIQCVSEGTPVTLVSGPQSGEGRSWWFVTAPDGRQGWMASDFLLLTTQTIPIRQSDSNGLATLHLEALDIQPGGDVVIQLAFTNDTSAPVRWESDRGNPSIYLTDDRGQRIQSVEVGGAFARNLPSGLPPSGKLYGWHRFVLPDLRYRGGLTLHYPNHAEMRFDLSPAR